MRSFTIRSWTCACAIAVVVLLLLGVPGQAAAQTVVYHSFEDGTTQGWGPRGDVTVANSMDVANNGTHSLKTIGRTQTWQGPSLNLLPLLAPGTIYQLKVSARLVSGEAATNLKMTVLATNRDGDTYTQLQSAGATDQGWVTLQGGYSVPFCLTGLSVYVESDSPTASFYVDDFSITAIPVVTCTNTAGLHTNFETGTNEGWGPRGYGAIVVAPTAADSHSGSYSLLTTGRTSAWMGPSIDVTNTMCKGNRYAVSVWVKLAPGQADTQLRVSVQRNLGSSASYLTFAGNKTVTSSAWVQFTGTFNSSADYTSMSVYVEANTSGTVSYYIDDVDLTWVSAINPGPPPPPPYCPTGPAIATGLEKYLGCAYSSPDQKVNFTAYWNQATPENGGKWGTVEGTRGTMNWGEMDAVYKLAKDNHFPVKFHTLVWGAQQPGWIAGLPVDEKLAEIKEWFAAVAARYPDLDQIDVVNEPIHQVLPTYIDALGGAGDTGWDWVLNSFRLARGYFPKAKLLINEYSVTNNTADMQKYIGIIKLLQKENLIDGVGVQGHYFSTRSYSGDLAATSAQQKANLDLLASQTGLPIYVTELDIAQPDDAVQLSEYQRVFPIFWENPGVKGITIWGYRQGLWQADAFLAYRNGAERPAFTWLQQYVESDQAPSVDAGQNLPIDGGSCNVIGKVTASDPDAIPHPGFAILQNWKIVGGSGQGIFAIDAKTGTLSIARPLDIDFTQTSYQLTVQVSDGFKSSEPQSVTISIPDKINVVHNGHAITIAKEAVPAHLQEHGDCLGTAGIQ